MMETLKTMLANVIVICGLLAITAWMQARDTEQANAIASADCRPSDKNEMAVQTIEDGRVFCEKHQRVSYGMAPVALACPISGACSQIASLK